MADRIRYKYSIKNVTGLNLLPFVRFDNPFDIIAHLMVGSEGTLAFLAQVTMQTAYNEPCKASAMLYFSTLKEACRAVVAMKKLTNAQGEWLVKSAELLDYKSLMSVDDPVYLRYRKEIESATTANSGKDLKGLTAVLTETKAQTAEELKQNIQTIETALASFSTYTPVYFTDKPEEYAHYWAIRSGIFPSVGGTRKPGTTCLIEDVAFHIEDLPQATIELQALLERHGYDDACIYGHALEGNYHFIINQSFDQDSEVKRYEELMNDVKELVVDRYDGSLKAEHGTGRNMAPFVRYEWGEEAFAVMQAVKSLFDPKGLLNPGVIFNDDPRCHISHFKPLPLLPFSKEDPASRANRCIECGFCEVNCLSCGFTLSSRQRIVLQREIARLQQSGEDNLRLKRLQKQYLYYGNQTCAGDGLCSLSCPMGINTGDVTHTVRQLACPPQSSTYRMGNYVAHHFAGIKQGMRWVLGSANIGHTLLGTKMMSGFTRSLHQTLGLPLWTPALPKPFHLKEKDKPTAQSTALRVVYFPSCINQAMLCSRKAVTK